MRVLILLPAILLAGCGGSAESDRNAQAQPDREQRYTIRAGPVPDARIGALSGTYQLLATADPSGIPSNRSGGACLVFPAADLDFPLMAAVQCSNNQSCTTTENPNGYCDVPARTCWSRPNRPDARGKLCNTGLILNPNDLNPVPAVAVDAASLGLRPGARVRVIACLNKLGADPVGTGCRSKDGPDRIEVMGPVATLR
jgi:hypothetical protein